jgi:hypothetical protein
MIHLLVRRAARCTSSLTPLLVILSLFLATSIAIAATVGDQVELKATHQAGVPLHKEPRGTNDFQRVPDGTQATVTEVAQDGRWIKLSLPDGRTGWVTSRYVSRTSASAPSPGPAPSQNAAHNNARKRT